MIRIIAFAVLGLIFLLLGVYINNIYMEILSPVMWLVAGVTCFQKAKEWEDRSEHQ